MTQSPSPRPFRVPTLPQDNIQRPSTSGSARDKAKTYYRDALSVAGVIVVEGFLANHPKLPASVQQLLRPTACIPKEYKTSVPSLFFINLRIRRTMYSHIDASYFYDNNSSSLSKRQIAAIDYVLNDRPRDMFVNSAAGRSEAYWAHYTKEQIFIPLLDAYKQMNIV